MAGVYRSGVMEAKKKKNKPTVFDRKIPVNPKYKHIQPTVDTGASLSRYMAKIEEIRKNYRYKKDELFKRMKWTTFVQLVLRIAEFKKSKEDKKNEILEEGEIEMSCRPFTADSVDLEVQKIQNSSPSVSQTSTEDEEFTDSAQATDQVHSADSGLYTSRSTLQDVIQGVGEIDQLTTPCPERVQSVLEEEEEENKRCPYLLLDVRDKDEFEQCHIITAHNYPSAMLSRTTNSETREMLSYKNKPGRLILLYDYDENVCPRVASTIAERGFDNLFLLSGGLKVAEKLFPVGLFVGHITPEPHNRQRKGDALVAVDQAEFCSKDLEELSIFLGKALQDKSVGTRLSKMVLSSRCASSSSFHSSHYAQQPPPPTPSSTSLSSTSSRRPFRN